MERKDFVVTSDEAQTPADPELAERCTRLLSDIRKGPLQSVYEKLVTAAKGTSINPDLAVFSAPFVSAVVKLEFGSPAEWQAAHDEILRILKAVKQLEEDAYTSTSQLTGPEKLVEKVRRFAASFLS